VFFGAMLVGLAFATVPASILNGISVRLADRRQDIGREGERLLGVDVRLALALTLALSAAILVIVVAMGS
jgi:hypothetical protein